MGIFMVKRGRAEWVVNADQATDDGQRFDRLGDPMLAESTVFFGALTADGAASFFNIFDGKITQFIPIETPKRNIADRESANRHTVEVVTMSINKRGQIAYLGSP
jgi:hypothetical protein